MVIWTQGGGWWSIKYQQYLWQKSVNIGTMNGCYWLAKTWRELIDCGAWLFNVWTILNLGSLSCHYPCIAITNLELAFTDGASITRMIGSPENGEVVWPCAEILYRLLAKWRCSHYHSIGQWNFNQFAFRLQCGIYTCIVSLTAQVCLICSWHMMIRLSRAALISTERLISVQTDEQMEIDMDTNMAENMGESL